MKQNYKALNDIINVIKGFFVIKREVMIKAKGLKMKYFDDGDFTCHIKKGEIIAITGPNGAGKTTFAKYLVRLISPEENCLYVSGLDVGKAENE